MIRNIDKEMSPLDWNAISRKTTIEILDIVLPIPKGCTSCGKRREALKRAAFIEWINTHRHLTDEEIIKRLKKMA